MSIHDYIFDDIVEDGKTLPFSRWDVLLIVILATALAVALGYSTDSTNGWTITRIATVVCVVSTVLFGTRRRRLVLGAAIGIIAVRLLVVAFLYPNPLRSVVAGIALGLIAWIVGRVY
jgi:hypothetical protein